MPFCLESSKWEKKEDKYFVLVDHHERELDGTIVGIIDHHVANKEINVDYYYNKSISSASCYICQGNEEFFDEKDLTLAFVAAMVDTASFNSTKGRVEDNDWIINLCKERNIDYEKIYETGLCLTDLSNLEQVSFNGLKHYNLCDKEIEASYIQVRNLEEKKEKLKDIGCASDNMTSKAQAKRQNKWDHIKLRGFPGG